MKILIKSKNKKLVADSRKKAFSRLSKIDYPIELKISYQKKAKDYNGEVYSVINDARADSIDEARSFLEAGTAKDLVTFIKNL